MKGQTIPFIHTKISLKLNWARVQGVLRIFILLITLTSCDSNLKHALELAGDNRGEMEKVLDHFKDDPDPLKYRAAKFLIENMPYHYSGMGKGVEQYDSAYLASSEEAIQLRDSVFLHLMRNADTMSVYSESDIKTLKADYLIKVIDEACSIWQSSTWHKDYDESMFFDYVLPYRLLDEPVSDWREIVKSEYPTLNSKDIRSRRGVEYEAEKGDISHAEVVSTESASKGEMVVLKKADSSVKIAVHSPLPSKKSVFLRYSCPAKGTKVRIKVNGITVSEPILEPTSTKKVFRDSRIGVDIDLKSGDNEISVEYVNAPVELDYIRISAVENYRGLDKGDFSKNIYRIRNRATGGCITFDFSGQTVLNDITLKQSVPSDSCTIIRLDYHGFGCWSISPAKHDSVVRCLEVKYCSLKENDPISQYEFLNGNHQKWVLLTLDDGSYRIMSKDSGLFLESVNDEEGKERIVQTSYAGKDSQKWKIENCGENNTPYALYPFGSAIAEALKVYDVTNQFEWYAFKGQIPPKASSLLKGRTGNCRDEAAYTVYLCRYLGIPAAVDFTPNWGNRSQGHSWSVIVTPDGKGSPFYMGCVPGDTVHYYHGYIKPKIFRRGYSLNREIAKDLKDEPSVPKLFQNADFIDVTDEYYTTTDVTMSVPEERKNSKAAYICVFDNRKWIPVHYGKITHGKVTFKSMGRNIVYIAATFDNGRIVPFGNPFLVSSDGDVKVINADTKHTQDMTLLRKYPFMGYQDHFNNRMSGGRFQASDYADFKTKVNLYTHEGWTDGNWYDVPVNDRNLYRYVRYLGPNGSYCNVNEIEFYSSEGKRLDGKIIGTEGIAGKEKEKVFDGDILTGFHGVSPDGHWVGLSLSKPSQIGRIRYIPRNDGNCIEIGDEYELMFWQDNKWISLGKKKATDNKLIYYNMPSGGLYVVRNLTKGHEERIFTYDDDKQVWW